MADTTAAFRQTAPSWESSIIWDRDDRNMHRIHIRAERLTELVETQFPDTPRHEIMAEAVDFICGWARAREDAS